MASSECSGNNAKTSWPELVGVLGDTAKETIEKENPAVTVVILRQGSIVDAQYREDRVRVFVDTRYLVVEVPKIG
ncbi:Proteinase inhibitor I13 [Macleaya cordata]|uniref:Proteinase inhibitor I13 n=1 Tax=Macleaya cordata TaxID=56857 RepID=A0A200Q4B0_MACCD|nr:Proteinase inhibitor I13 [Macleaya cordata]